MIITITMNPSIDFTYIMDSLITGKLNRTKSPTRNVGGKGINAGRTAALSGSKVVLTGFLGGKMGRLAKEYLEEENLFHIQMNETKGETRAALTIMHDNSQHTEIVEEGPYIENREIDALLEKVKGIVVKEEVHALLICGSVRSNNSHIIEQIIDFICKNISSSLPILVDISGIQLKNLLATKGNKPTFIKPNEHELSSIVNKKIQTKEEAYQALQHPSFEEIPYVIASLGKNGAVCKVGSDFYQVTIPKIPIQSVTGSGDATVGGFAYALENNFDTIKAIRYSMACGMSNAQHKESGKIDKKAVLEFMEKISVEKISSYITDLY